MPEIHPPKPKPFTSDDRKRIEADNKRWDDVAAACKEQRYRIVEIPMVEILPVKSTPAIISALNRFYARLRGWGLPVFRLRSDCAPEFTHEHVKQWAGHVGIITSTTVPENPALNGRAGRLVECQPGLWPHATRYVVEGLLREQLELLGHEVKPLAPFHSLVKFRARTWREPVGQLKGDWLLRALTSAKATLSELRMVRCTVCMPRSWYIVDSTRRTLVLTLRDQMNLCIGMSLRMRQREGHRQKVLMPQCYLKPLTVQPQAPEVPRLSV